MTGQFLQTDEAVGYVVIDVDQADSQLAYQALKDVPGTMRCRVLFS